GNRIDFDGAIDYRYDAHGNLVERYDHAGPCRLHLGYDGLHQLHCSKRTEHDGQSRTTWYDYDAFGRRIAKQTGDQITWYGWDGDRLCLIDNPDRQSRIVYRPGSFTPLLRLDTAKPPKQAAWKP
ncbi:hypothetical protein PZA18_24395, partial [Chitinimonas sp. DQS-5]|nr:hypothetical protein [Parachitinimonas caeni]